MKRKTIAIEKLALMLGEELGAGTVEASEVETAKPPMFWTLIEKFRHWMMGYIPMEKRWQFLWELPGGFHYKTSMLAREINPDYLYDIWEEIVNPIAKRLLKLVREQREADDADA